MLRAPDIPSVLVELGYVSNQQDLQSLLSDTWRDRTADTMAQAIDSYFATHVAALAPAPIEPLAALGARNGLSLNKKPSDDDTHAEKGLLADTGPLWRPTGRARRRWPRLAAHGGGRCGAGRPQ